MAGFHQDTALEVAGELESWVERIQAGSAIGGALGGAALAALPSFQLLEEGAFAGVISGAVVGGLLGFAFGRATSLPVRLQAQTLLTLIQIEQNTRPSTRAEGP